METNRSPRETHVWISRHLEPVSGQPVIHQVCQACGRCFVDESSTGKRYAVHASVSVFHRLSDEVTARWLSEKCPGERLMADEADRRTRFLSGGLFRSAVHEKANDGRDSGSPPNRKNS